MKITVSDDVEEWYKKELELQEGDGVRFFGKYGGATNVHTGFSTGMEVTKPTTHPLRLIEKNGIRYFIEETDDWFFDGYDLAVDFDKEKDEPTYYFTET